MRVCCILIWTINLFIFLSIFNNKDNIHSSPSEEFITMPIIRDIPWEGSGKKPVADRTLSVRKFLSTSVKIVAKSIGSGTIIYYDPNSKSAYVQSCGHLWSGNLTAIQAQQNPVTCEIEVFYHNEIKLKHKEQYKAEVIYYNNEKDVSLIRFRPNWTPKYYFIIGVNNYQISKGEPLHSTGCDGDTEPAEYLVSVIKVDNNDLITTENSPRPGRSGGGLLTSDGCLIGICKGTSDTKGVGIGVFTPLHTIREMNQENGYGWLNEISDNLINQIPILDHNSNKETYDDKQRHPNYKETNYYHTLLRQSPRSFV